MPVALPKLADLIDAAALQSLMEDFYAIAAIPMAILDIDGVVLVGVGWQDVCTRFHRVHPETCRACIESDTQLTTGVAAGEFRVYKCKNHMWDVATPIVVRDRHVGNVFTGQFFFTDECIDYDLFREQARRHGFDEEEYLAALDRAPRLSREAVNKALAFFVKLAHMVSRLGDANLTLRQAMTERKALLESLQQADQRKDEFIAILSHELRNPLAPIRYALPLLQDEHLSGPGARAATVISRQVDQLSRLVDDLLDVSRITRGKIELRRERVSVDTIVTTAVEAASPAITAAQLRLKLVEPHEPIQLHVDPTRISQVLTNILNNSAKYTPRGGEVALEVTQEGGYAVVRVRDTGIGIAPDALPTVFEIFHQAGNRADRSAGGLGIGLALVKRLTEMHGGVVEAHSSGVGKGAEFVVRLPISEDAAAARLASPAHRSKGDQRLRVLVVDDNTDFVEMVALVVERLGHEVRTAHDGRSAVSTAVSYRPHVVLLDVGLPFMSGLDVARELRRREETANARLVAITGWGQADDRRRTREAGFDDHLTKPTDPKTLERLLAECSAA